MKDTVKPVRRALKRLLLGSANVHQYCPVALHDPQSEVSVWLHGLGAPRDVTGSNVVASTRPLTIGIGAEKDLPFATVKRAQLSLKFLERQGRPRVLGEIGLRLTEGILLEDGQLFLFEPCQCRNYCVARPWLWTRYLFLGYRQWQARRSSPAPELQIPAGQIHCLFVFYICPRPVVLVSVGEADLVNIIPMDLIGPVSPRCFSLALHSTSTAAPLFESSRRIALSSVPSEQAAVAYRLGKNHKAPCADVNHLPFVAISSAAFGLPVPSFAMRVREMEIESVRSVGSYKLFLARAVEDRCVAAGPQLFLVHGFYERLADSSQISLAAQAS
jgi:flavin reductase (DIM6/NTAB) family NADH-FMN oxidoreductase RutF